MAKYSLVGVNGNAYAVMGYTSRALIREGLEDLVDEMHEKAKSGDYYHLLSVCDEYIGKANQKAVENGYEDEDTEDEY